MESGKYMEAAERIMKDHIECLPATKLIITHAIARELEATRASALSEREGEVKEMLSVFRTIATTAATIEYARALASEALALTNGGGE